MNTLPFSCTPTSLFHSTQHSRYNITCWTETKTALMLLANAAVFLSSSRRKYYSHLKFGSLCGTRSKSRIGPNHFLSCGALRDHTLLLFQSLKIEPSKWLYTQSETQTHHHHRYRKHQRRQNRDNDDDDMCLNCRQCTAPHSNHPNLIKYEYLYM